MIATEQFKIPHLTTALTGALYELEKQIIENQINIESWLRRQWHIVRPPITSSVDVRNAGFKVAPVDTNLFPAGFNNLNRDFLPLCIQAAQAELENTCPNALRILIIPENHTRNLFYFESLATLQEIFLKAGFEVRVGSLSPEITEPRVITLKSGNTITLEPVFREKNIIRLANFEPCLILLNNDLSEGIPDILQNLEQTIRPTPQISWAKRLKSEHFSHYQDVAEELGELIGLDPWLINPYFSNCGEVDFMQGTGQTCLVAKATELFSKINKKYAEYNIKQKPFLAIKADAGTYGMSVMMIESPEELQNLNRKQRTKMSTAKGNVPVTKVILQEGVHTCEEWGEKKASAEPVVYMIGKHVIGGFYRVHSSRSNAENLNSPGMQFEPLAFAESCNNPCVSPGEDQHNRFYTYGVIARLAMLAAAREISETKP